MRRFYHLIKHPPAHMYTARKEAVGPQHTVSGYSGTRPKRMISREQEEREKRNAIILARDTKETYKEKK